MKPKLPVLLACVCLSTFTCPLAAFAQGTAFTYQGRLNDGASPATGSYDLKFTLFDAASVGNVVGAPLTNAATPITNGLLTVTLDFGAATPHVGPMAQDFHAAFGVGTDDKHIATLDADGVALAAIQGLNQKVEEQRNELNQKQTEIADLQQRLAGLEKLMQRLASKPIESKTH